MDIFRKIAERRIEEAMNKGVFDRLPGSGQPLHMDEDPFVPEDLRMGYRVLKNAGFVPPEVALRKEISSLRELIDTIDDDAERLRRIRQLNFKLMRLGVLLKRPLNLEDYENRLSEKVVSGK